MTVGDAMRFEFEFDSPTDDEQTSKLQELIARLTTEGATEKLWRYRNGRIARCSGVVGSGVSPVRVSVFDGGIGWLFATRKQEIRYTPYPEGSPHWAD